MDNGSIYEVLIEQGATPEQIEAVMQMFGAQEEGQYAQQDLAQAQALQNAPGPRGRHAGRTYVAANPLEHLGTALQRYGGRRDANDARSRQEKILARMKQGTRAFFGNQGQSAPQSMAAGADDPWR